MRLFLKPIHEWLISNYNLFEHPMKNYITMGIIGVIATSIAWFSVKAMYNGGDIKSSEAGSFFYWLISFKAISVMFVTISIVMWIIKIIIAIPWWFWIFLIFAVSGTCYYIVHTRRGKV